MAKKIFKGIGKLALGVVGSVLGKKLLGGGKKKSSQSSGRVMPIAEDEAAMAARKKSIALQRQRGGRTSTILTDNEPLGGN